ncbi:MAG: DnaA ATPase domain-containing protein, partial [Clostridium sp.]
MDEELKELWEKTLDIIKGELSEVSFNTWIKSCEPISMSSNIIKISVPNAFTQEILEKRYKDLVANSIKAICSKLYNIEFLIASEIQNSEEDESEKKHNNLKSNKKVIVNDEMTNNLNPKYTFDSFVIGNSNRFAHAASLAVAESPAKAYNPLFIYGGVGLGKTHLMHAIGHYVLKNNPNAKVVYVSSEKFTNELINA